jgi:SAM-dependent methyltransferase
MTEDKTRPDYGIDAPGVIRNLAIAGVLALSLAIASRIGVLPEAIVIPVGKDAAIRIPIFPTGLWSAVGLLAGAVWMYLGSRTGKIAERERLLDRIPWKGDEQVLDVGCGRGLVLNGAARRLTTGSATGVDIWRAEDLSGNRPEIPLANAAIEGVRERVKVQTADMRRLPFADRSFDVVVSRAAIHNLPSAADRAAAIREIARVLKPGGIALISDIRHAGAYARIFAAHGCRDVRRLDSRLAAIACTLATLGSLSPHITLARRDA